MIVRKSDLKYFDFFVKYAILYFPLCRATLTVTRNFNMRFSMMWPSAFTYVGQRMLFTTGIDVQHVARSIESDLPRDRLIRYFLFYICH